MSEELDLHELITDEYQARVSDAIDNASDQDKITWLTNGAKRIAAIVPVDVAEYHEQMIAVVLRTPLDVIDELRGFGAGPSTECKLCAHWRSAHTYGGECQMCEDGKCRTPAERNQHDLEVAARAGLLSRRYH
jgi:hypothetical protein